MSQNPSFQHKKSLGQHFLNNAAVPKAMADAGDVQKGDIILEIGPGTGMLTRELLKRGARVVALEADIRAITALELEFADEMAAKRLMVVHGDARTTTITSLSNLLKPGDYKVIANIPYYLSGMLFRVFLESKMQPKTLVFLVQREVALRIARDKKESILSLSVKVFGNPRYVKTIKPGNFIPPPKVDSAILAVTHISHERLRGADESAFFTILHAGFASKRKQLFGNLSKIFPREQLEHIFHTLGFEKKVRGEDLTLPEWVSLTHELSPLFSPK